MADTPEDMMQLAVAIRAREIRNQQMAAKSDATARPQKASSSKKSAKARQDSVTPADLLKRLSATNTGVRISSLSSEAVKALEELVARGDVLVAPCNGDKDRVAHVIEASPVRREPVDPKIVAAWHAAKGIRRKRSLPARSRKASQKPVKITTNVHLSSELFDD